MTKRSLKSNLSLYCLTNTKLQKIIIILLAEEAWPDYQLIIIDIRLSFSFGGILLKMLEGRQLLKS